MTIHRIAGHRDSLRLAGLTMAEIAKELGVPRSTVYRWHAKGNRLFAAWVSERERAERYRQAFVARGLNAA